MFRANRCVEGVSACRRVGVSACRRVGVSACRRCLFGLTIDEYQFLRPIIVVCSDWLSGTMIGFGEAAVAVRLILR